MHCADLQVGGDRGLIGLRALAHWFPSSLFPYQGEEPSKVTLADQPLGIRVS